MKGSKMTFVPTESGPMHGGTFERYFFENGYGASIIDHAYSYGTELAVIKGTKGDWDLCYDTPITDDILGWQSAADIESVLTRIADLPPA
jgi:hypothetical protein